MFTLMHVADVHLDTPFMGRPGLREELRRLQRETFRAAADEAILRNVNAFVIAGDLVDGDMLSYASVCLIRETAEKLVKAGITVIYACGNHDPADLLPRLEFPEGVEVFSGLRPRMITVKNREGIPVGSVAGFGFESSEEPEGMWNSFPARTNLPTIGIAHTQLVEESGAGTGYAPVSLSVLERLNYDYWALGHIHTPRQYRGAAYCGALMGRDFGETGERGALLVCCEAYSRPRITRIPLAKAVFEKTEIKSEAGISTLRELREHIVNGCSETVRGDKTFLRITVSGECACAAETKGALGEENRRYMEKEIKDRLGIAAAELIWSGLTPPVETEGLEREPNVLGETLRYLKEFTENDRAVLQVLSELEDVRLAGFKGGTAEEAIRYVREITEGLDKELVLRFAKENKG